MRLVRMFLSISIIATAVTLTLAIPSPEFSDVYRDQRAARLLRRARKSPLDRARQPVQSQFGSDFESRTWNRETASYPPELYTRSQKASDNCLRKHVDELLKDPYYRAPESVLKNSACGDTFNELILDCKKKHRFDPRLNEEYRERVKTAARAFIKEIEDLGYHDWWYQCVGQTYGWNPKLGWVVDIGVRSGAETDIDTDIGTDINTEANPETNQVELAQPDETPSSDAIGDAVKTGAGAAAVGITGGLGILKGLGGWQGQPAT